MRYVLAICLLALVGCTSQGPDGSVDNTAPSAANEPWSFDKEAPDLRAASCPEGQTFERAVDMDISVTEIDLGPETAQGDQLQDMTFAGAWHLTADDPNFGGLSGLDTLRSGSLVAISDAGAWVWIGIDAETGAPDGIGSLVAISDAGAWVWIGIDAETG
ncbi:MAG: hypothetical protein AAFR74_07555, partial [Pseudomonadota bacterium]